MKRVPRICDNMHGEKDMTVDSEIFKKRRVEGAIVAFIRGKKNMRWVIGTIKGKWGVKDNELEEILDRIPYVYINYNNILLEQLRQKCLKEGLIGKK